MNGQKKNDCGWAYEKTGTKRKNKIDWVLLPCLLMYGFCFFFCLSSKILFSFSINHPFFPIDHPPSSPFYPSFSLSCGGDGDATAP